MKKRCFLLVGAGLSLAISGSMPAAVLTSVPMGGPMVHANVAYRAALGRLEVHVESVVPRLTPLDVSSPADSFDPGDPWFAWLDPSTQGLAFNRQYGIVMDASTDPVPATMGIWIRHLDRTPGLGLYRYRSSGTRLWDPMFGTDGSTNVWEWNLSMFHPSAAASPSNGTHSANFEAFAVDLATRTPLPGIEPGPFTLNWTNVASSRVLRFERDRSLTWGAEATNYVLECTDTLPPRWTTVTNAVVVAGGRCKVPIECQGVPMFYRLRRLP